MKGFISKRICKNLNNNKLDYILGLIVVIITQVIILCLVFKLKG